ncbi:uncharacterized protein LOC124593906 [Schistocerca americana]|uniref:uncharacterized protein LOC124593906 n=1 Tax=Schistocerca americana TaxID=7009 RepID=UPI001F4F3108|nr:uncharacterized protein LOC124593906 [Schistocerca americana]
MTDMHKCQVLRSFASPGRVHGSPAVLPTPRRRAATPGQVATPTAWSPCSRCNSLPAPAEPRSVLRLAPTGSDRRCPRAPGTRVSVAKLRVRSRDRARVLLFRVLSGVTHQPQTTIPGSNPEVLALRLLQRPRRGAWRRDELGPAMPPLGPLLSPLLLVLALCAPRVTSASAGCGDAEVSVRRVVAVAESHRDAEVAVPAPGDRLRVALGRAPEALAAFPSAGRAPLQVRLDGSCGSPLRLHDTRLFLLQPERRRSATGDDWSWRLSVPLPMTLRNILVARVAEQEFGLDTG